MAIWILSFAVVLLALWNLGLGHRISVLRWDYEHHAASPFKHLNGDLRLTGSDWRLVWDAIHNKADAHTCGELNESLWAELAKKADKPLLRRATDKKESHWTLTAAYDDPTAKALMEKQKKSGKRRGGR
jgi:hypothetical protein